MAVWSEIYLSCLPPSMRLDPEYYKPENYRLIAELEKAGAKPIGSFADVTDGIHASPQWVEDGEGVTYLSAKSVKDNYITLTSAGQISKAQDTANQRTRARVGDVLLTTVGTIGNAAVVEAETLPANMDRHLGIIRVLDDTNPYYLATFLNSKYGRFQSLREATGNVQLNLFIEAMKSLLVPTGSGYKHIGEVTKRAYDMRSASKDLYAEAEALLLHELQLDTLDLSHQLTYERDFSELSNADRYDADYFQPKYQNALATMGVSGRRIQDVAHLAKRPFSAEVGRTAAQANSDSFEYIEIGNMSGDGQANSEIVLKADAPSRAKQWVVSAGDVTTSKVRPIGNAAIVRKLTRPGTIWNQDVALRPASARLSTRTTIEPEVLLNCICV